MEIQVRSKIIRTLPPSWRKIADEEVGEVKGKILETLKSLGSDMEVDVLMVDEVAKSIVLLRKIHNLINVELGKMVEGKARTGKINSYIASYEKLSSIILDWLKNLALVRKERLTLEQQEKAKDAVDNMVKELMGMK